MVKEMLMFIKMYLIKIISMDGIMFTLLIAEMKEELSLRFNSQVEKLKLLSRI
jgi:hypothetical protein